MKAELYLYNYIYQPTAAVVTQFWSLWILVILHRFLVNLSVESGSRVEGYNWLWQLTPIVVCHYYYSFCNNMILSYCTFVISLCPTSTVICFTWWVDWCRGEIFQCRQEFLLQTKVGWRIKRSEQCYLLLTINWFRSLLCLTGISW